MNVMIQDSVNGSPYVLSVRCKNLLVSIEFDTEDDLAAALTKAGVEIHNELQKQQIIQTIN